MRNSIFYEREGVKNVFLSLFPLSLRDHIYTVMYTGKLIKIRKIDNYFLEMESMTETHLNDHIQVRERERVIRPLNCRWNGPKKSFNFPGNKPQF